MKYISTRGGVSPLSFEDAVLSGLADDEGLLVPQTVPQVLPETLEKWQDLSFPELAFEIMSLYISEDEIPRNDLRNLIDKSLRSFTHPKITPVIKVADLFLLELFHGPTFSFKDIALQFLGNLFEYILKKRNSSITVVGATSGDTGSAAIHGLKGKNNVDIFILFPKGRVSHVQELQMTTVLDSNVHSLSLTGTFDDCQSIVKSLFGDLEFKRKYRLGAINSINWSRIMSQTVYYFYSYFSVKKSVGKDVKLVFSVPTGNFGDILAGYYAKRMGLPVHYLVVATNANDILDRFFSKGEYHRGNDVIPTCTPSMDIQVASNFERYLYYLCGENSSQVLQWMTEFQKSGRLTVSGPLLQKAQSDFRSLSVDQNDTVSAIRHYYVNHGYLMDPHTAVGVKAAEILAQSQKFGDDARIVCLSTAHPAKFGEIVKKAIHDDVDVVRSFEPTRKLMENGTATRCHDLGANLQEVKSFVEKVLADKI